MKVFSLVLVYVFNFDIFEFSAAILEKGLLNVFVERIHIEFISGRHENQVTHAP